MTPVYKVARLPMWREAERAGRVPGSADDERDGFIHLSTAAQLAGTLAKHFAGQDDLVLATIDPSRLGPGLRWEPSRGGQLFPHVYGDLPVAAVVRVELLPLGSDGSHRIPADVGGPADSDAVAALEQAGWTRRDATAGGFIDLIGPVWSRQEGDDLLMGLLVERRHLNRNAVAHGGLVMSFADQALGVAAWRANGEARQVTIQLDTHFISGAREGEFLQARCRVVRQTRSLMFMGGELSVGDRPVATAQGVWKLLGRPDQAGAGIGDAGKLARASRG